MAWNDEFCENYLVLTPEEASFFDLFRVLFSRNLEERRGVKCKLELIKEAHHRQLQWLIFVSLLLQKILLLSAKPMSWVGSVLDQWLNLISCNGGLTKLVLNFITGSVVLPDKSSSTYTSIAGNLDLRVDLDKSIKHGDCRYYGALSMMASKLVYENKAFVQNVVTNHWKMKFLGFYNFWNDYQQKVTTRAFMFQDEEVNPEIIVVTFRGTEAFNASDWITDVDISWYEIPGVGKVHGGFMKALGLQRNLGWPKDKLQEGNHHSVAYYSIRELLRKMLEKNKKAKFIVTGHSLGGALAILFPLILSLHEETWILERLEAVYTFGQPRVGDQKLGDYMKKKLKVYGVRYIRLVYCNDMVPRLPFDDSTLLFKHFGTCIYYNSLYECKIVQEEPNKNYFSILDGIAEYLNAMWELIRSFIIQYMKGPDYAEGWCMRMYRLVGLVIPGLPVHAPPDYVNCTRLASPCEHFQ